MKVDSCSSSCLLPFQQFLPVMKNDWSKKKLVGFSSCPLSRGWKTVGRSSTVRVSSISSIFSQYFPNGSYDLAGRSPATTLQYFYGQVVTPVEAEKPPHTFHRLRLGSYGLRYNHTFCTYGTCPATLRKKDWPGLGAVSIDGSYFCWT